MPLNRSVRLRFAILALTVFSSRLPAQDNSDTVQTESFLGVCSQVTRESRSYNPYAVQQQLMSALEEINIEFTRTGFLWHTVHPKAGEWDWRITDEVVASAREKNINILAMVGGMPRWVADAPAEHIDLWAEFVDSLSIRYVNDIRYWEIWNEPNIRAGKYWPQNALPDVFADYVIRAAQIIRKNQAQATIILGGLATGQKAKPFQLWEELFKLGVLDVVDGIAYHTYQYTGTALIDFNQRVAALVGKYTTERKEYWITEYGVPAVESDRSDKWSYETQKRDLLKSALVHWATGGTKFFIFALWDKQVFDSGTDAKQARKNKSSYFGLLEKDLSPKPSFQAVGWLSNVLRNYIPVKIEQTKGGVLITARSIQTGEDVFFSWGGRVHGELWDSRMAKNLSRYEAVDTQVVLSGSSKAQLNAFDEDVLFWR